MESTQPGGLFVPLLHGPHTGILANRARLCQGTGRRQDVGEDCRQELREQALELDEKMFDDVMRNLPRASGPGSSQWRWEHMWAVHVSGARVVALLKDDLGVNVRPIACGEVLWKLVAKADARNAFNAVHREAMFEAIERDFPELWAWTDLCYGVEANLGFRLGGVDGSVMRFVKLKEGTQGDPLGLLYLAAPLQMVLERQPSVVISAYSVNAFFLGPPIVVALAYETYMEEAVAIGLDIQPVKSAAFSPEGDAICFEVGMPGARGELDFIDVLWVPVGKAEAARREGVERLALMDRVWEDAFEETDYATQDGLGGGTQESGGTQHEQSEQASGGGGEGGAITSRLLESMEDVRREAEHLSTVGGQGGGAAEARSGGARAGTSGLSQVASSVEDILAEWEDLSSPGPEGGVWTQEQSGASPEQAMALAEGGVATLMGASRRVAGLLGGVDGMGGTDEDDGGDVGRSAGGVDPRRAPQSPGAHPGSDDHLQQVARQHTASHQLPCPWGEVAGRAGINTSSQGNHSKGFSHVELVLGVEGYRRKLVAGAQALGRVGDSRVILNVGLVVKRWLEWRSQSSVATGCQRSRSKDKHTHILTEWEDLFSPGPEGGVWTHEQSGASPEQAMALAEGGAATLMGASRRVVSLLEGAVGVGGAGEGDEGDVTGRHVRGDDTRRAPQSPGAHPGSDDHLQLVARQHTASH
ncbi:hypothetical protein CYMTET_51572 [Cymbomonas tetramitiformis]|uniref:Uncharacterized protein n=1 Tax=Cymbomonas tetramitiformis TaxID=36881 RepID=A0AAE0BMH8_9CHLO|nr:hypothetical protein CYMTET_51572 [Cymbomonas tetramitiformis]